MSEGNAWEDLIVAERLEVDRAFQDRIRAAELPNQSWELVMTAVQFEIENPADPDGARLVANTDRLESVLPAMREVEASMGYGDARGSGGGLLDRVRSLFGGSGGGRRAEAERLADAYAEELEGLLVERGKWEQVCATAAN